VYNLMHILPLNLFKSFVEHLVTKGEAINVDQALDEINIHHPKRLEATWPSSCAIFYIGEHKNSIFFALVSTLLHGASKTWS
jgi:hypothetical protein